MGSTRKNIQRRAWAKTSDRVECHTSDELNSGIAGKSVAPTRDGSAADEDELFEADASSEAADEAAEAEAEAEATADGLLDMDMPAAADDVAVGSGSLLLLKTGTKSSSSSAI
jgi:hypothetical protein